MTTKRWDAETVPAADLQVRQARVLPLLPESGTVLEVGSGAGHTLGLLARSGRLLLGIDISPALLRTARGRDDGFENVQADARHLPLASSSFDIVLAQEVLEHIPDWQAVLAEMFRSARHRVVVMVPYREWLKGQTCSSCGGWVPLYGHVRRFTPGTFSPWQIRGRMTVETVGPPLDWRAYWRKAMGWLQKDHEAEPTQGVPCCPHCSAFLPEGLHWRRAIDRVWRLVTRKPEWLLVVWRLGEE